MGWNDDDDTPLTAWLAVKRLAMFAVMAVIMFVGGMVGTMLTNCSFTAEDVRACEARCGDGR